MSILNSFKDITSSVFIHIQKLLNMNPSDISNDTKEKTKSILIEGQIQKQTERINKVLKERQAEIDKTRTPEEIQKAKDEFRQRMYKATSNLKKEDTLEKGVFASLQITKTKMGKNKKKNKMSKLLFDTLKFFAKAGKGALTYSHVKRQDLRNETGLMHSLLTGEVSSNKGARFLSESEQLKFLKNSNKGLLIDGKNKRLNLEDSFKHLLLVAQTGAGKTTKFIIPNILELANSDNSIIVTDPSGEIFSLTSGYMQKKGYEVLKFDPTDPEHSIYFNPLRFVYSYSNGKAELDQVKASLLASSLVSSTLSGEKDAFWRAGAESILEFFVACLKETPRDCHNLYNVYKLVESMTPDGKLLEDFMLSYVFDRNLIHKWTSFLGNSNSTLRSQLTTVQTALKPLANEHIAKMLAKNSVDFKSLKQKKTILYLTFPVNEAHFYTFILNLFYTQLFHEYMSELPKKSDLPLFILYDEFGHANIPNFDMVITNIRKYKVSLTLVLQSLSQLETQYGKNRSKTIIEGGVNSKLFYSGASLDTAGAIEKMLGKVIRDDFSASQYGGKMSRQEFNLLNADEIRTLPEHQAFFIMSNKKPMLINTEPYYANRKYKNVYKLGTASIRANNFHRFELTTVFDFL